MGGMNNYGNPDPTSGFTGSNVYGYNLSGNYPDDLDPAEHLTSTPLDLSNMTNVILKFERWLCVEENIYDEASVGVSTDGVSFTTVWENGRTLNGGYWSTHEIDISAIANLRSAVYLRWTMGTTDGGWMYCGWNIDDIEVSGIQTVGCTMDADCDDGLFCSGMETCDVGCAAAVIRK